MFRCIYLQKTKGGPRFNMELKELDYEIPDARKFKGF